MEEVACALGCGGDGEVVVSAVDLLHDMPGQFTVVRCRTCGLMRTSPRPSSIDAFYPPTYGPHRESGSPHPAVQRGRIGRIVAGLLDSRARHSPDLPPGRLLEFGCGTGDYLATMTAQNWRAIGLDMSERAVDTARTRGLEAHLDSPDQFDFSGRQFDLIAGWMALEHMPDPVVTLTKLRAVAAPGGYLALSVPRCDSLEFRVFGRRWYALQLPTHFWHFTAGSLDAVLQQTGWKRVARFDQRTLTNAVVSSGWILRDCGVLSRLADRLIRFPHDPGRLRLLLAPLAAVAAACGQTGRMTVWATADDR